MSMNDAIKPAAMVLLYVEDDALLAAATARLLRRSFPTATLIMAADSTSAIASLELGTVTHVLCDFDLANGTRGDEVLAWVHANAPALLGRFTFLSANDATAELHGRCISKPCAPSQIRAALEAA